MSVMTVAAAGTAVALWLYSRRPDTDDEDGVAATHATAHSAPNTFTEDLYYFSEGLRYTYRETLGRWRTADLLFGLTYLCRKDPAEPVESTYARLGRPLGSGGLSASDASQAASELRLVARAMRYCAALRERDPARQRAAFASLVGLGPEHVLRQRARAGVLKPSFVLAEDARLGAVVLAVRGTHSFRDMFTSLTGASKPHHVVDARDVTLGYAHFGMLAAARWLLREAAPAFEAALRERGDGWRPLLVGHSLGAGTAALLCMMLRERGGAFADARAVALACPACVTLELAQSCAGYVLSVVHGADVVPTISPAAADGLRARVARSSWGRDWGRDVRASPLVRAVERGLSGVRHTASSAGAWTGTALAACYQRRPGKGADPAPSRGSPPSSEEDRAEEPAAAPRQLGRKRRSEEQPGGGPGPGPSPRASRWEGLGARVSLAAGRGSRALRQSWEGWWSPRRAEAAAAEEEAPGDGRGEDARRPLEGASRGAGRGRAHRRQPSLEDELAARMGRVAEAVSQAEAEGSGDEADCAAVPAVIRPGGYGAAGEGGSARDARARDSRWRRALFPAGRVLHLVPLAVVRALDAEWERLGGEGGGGGAMEGVVEAEGVVGAEGVGGEDVGAEDAAVEMLEDVVQALSSVPPSSLPSSPPSSSQPSPSQPSPSPPTSSQRSPSQPSPSQPSPASLQPMVLLDRLPHRAYAEIRLSRAVLSDHIIPSYMAALDRALAQLPPELRRALDAGQPGDWGAGCLSEETAAEAGRGR